MMRKLVVAAAAGIGLLAGTAAPGSAATLPAPGQEKPTTKRVPPALMGMHVHSLTDTPPTADERFGGIRLWDNGVRWDEVNTDKGVYDWTRLDQAVANSQATGAKDIMYVLGYTPNWAADIVKPPCQPGKYTGCSYFPTGSGSKPKDIEDWKTWVGAVAARYEGKITQYQIWNESNLTSFFDTPGEDSAVVMADLTVAAERVIRRIDPKAKVITASSTIVQKKSFVKRGWLKRYLDALKQKRSKPDGIAVHTYPWIKKGPGNGTLKQRNNGLDLAKQVIRSAGYKKLPILDTEMNYGNQRDNGWPTKKYSQKTGSAYLAQTYLDSLHNGVIQVDWYGWDDYGLGIWPTTKSGRVLKPGTTYQTLLKNLAGKRNKGCTITKKVTVCLVKKGKTRDYYVYRPKKKRLTFTVPKSFKVRQACDVVDKCKKIRRNKVKVGLSPLRLTR